MSTRNKKDRIGLRKTIKAISSGLLADYDLETDESIKTDLLSEASRLLLTEAYLKTRGKTKNLKEL